MRDRFSTMDQGSVISFPSHFDIDPKDRHTFDDDVLPLDERQAHSSARMLTGIDRFIQDPEITFTDRTIKLHAALNEVMGEPDAAPVQLADPADHIASPLSELSLRSSRTLSRVSTNDTFSSFGATTVSRSAHHPATSINLGDVPSIHARPDIRDFDDLPSMGERVQVSVNCILKDIDRSPCDDTFIGEGFNPWYRHHMKHFGPHGPPGHALCGFCDAEFKNEEKPKACWKLFLKHLYLSHLRNGANIIDMRPDFCTLKYMLDKDIITQYRYDEICKVATERKEEQYPDLKPADWVPDKHKSKKLLEEEEEYNAKNRVIQKERPVRRREQDRREHDRRDSRR